MKSNARAMVLASFAADTLSLGVHWIYDTEQILQKFGRVRDLLPPHQGSYHPARKKGEFTHYGDQAFHLLQHLAEHQGEFNPAVYAGDWQRLFTDYDGYVDKATQATLKNMKTGLPPESSGSPSTDLGGAARIAPLNYSCRDDLEKLLQAVKDQTALTHNGPGVIDGALFIARSCYAILHGVTPYEAFVQALEFGISDVDLDLRLRTSIDLKNRSTGQAIKEFGQTCAISAALPGAVFTVLQHTDNLEEALIETVMAGGDSAARGMVVGMMLGAHLGEDGIPGRWLDDMVKYHAIDAALGKLP